MGNGTTFAGVAQNLNDGEFRNWTKQLHDAILRVGLTDASASGAITSGSDSSEFDSLSRPGFANTDAGFIVYRFSDVLQATLPVFIKVEYGTGGSTSRQAVFVTVGVSLTSASLSAEESSVTASTPFTQREQLAAGANAANAHQFFIGGDTNYLTFTGPSKDLADQNDGPSSWFFACERTKNASGDDTADGILVGANTTAATYKWYSLPASGSVPARDIEFPTAIGSQDPATHTGRQVVSPVFPLYSVSPNPGRNLLSCQNLSFRDLDIIPISIFAGKQDDYIKLPTNVASSVGNASQGHLLLRFT